MHIKIGIPRGLLYYYYYPLWTKFFEMLEAEVIVSKKTNKIIVDQGVKNSVDEACLPIKVYHGHVIDLQNQVNYIFLPKIMSIYKNEFICPKFCGLPEMVRHSIKNLPPFIDTTIDFRKSRKELYKTVYEIGSYFTKDVHKIEFAFNKALTNYYFYKSLIKRGILPVDILEKPKRKKQQSLEQKILVLGHPYTIYDPFISMNLIDKLRNYQLEVLTQDSFDTKEINRKAETMDKKMFWTFGRKILGAALCAMEQGEVKGVIYLSSFGCGLDSVIGDIIERRIRRESDIPFMLLTIDEHTGEAGIDTRIEAFVDMIRWRGKNENYISAYGEYLYTR